MEIAEIGPLDGPLMVWRRGFYVQRLLRCPCCGMAVSFIDVAIFIENDSTSTVVKFSHYLQNFNICSLCW